MEYEEDDFFFFNPTDDLGLAQPVVNVGNEESLYTDSV